jgi:hypothetical protein
MQDFEDKVKDPSIVNDLLVSTDIAQNLVIICFVLRRNYLRISWILIALVKAHYA